MVTHNRWYRKSTLVNGTIDSRAADNFLLALERTGSDEIEVSIVSGGGSVVHGLSIFNAIRRERQRGRQVTTFNAGACYSIAAIIFQAGNPRIMSDGALLMLHLPYTESGGTADELRKSANLLDKTASELSGIIASRANQPVETVRNWLRAESWFDSREAVSFGLADRRDIEAPANAAMVAQIVNQYKIPERYRNQLRQPIDATLADIESNTRAAIRTSTYDGFKMFQRLAVDAADKLTRQPGTTASDMKRAADAVESLARAEDIPRKSTAKFTPAQAGFVSLPAGGFFLLFSQMEFVMATNTGSVAKVKIDAGYGFLAPRGGGRDLFFHCSDLVDLEFSEQLRELQVQFECVEDAAGRPRARNVRAMP